MNLSYLRSFYTTVKFNSISKAAKELHLTQPGLSMQLQALENEIGVQLLNRSNKGVQLTPEGSLVYEFSETMLSLEDNLQKKLLELKNHSSNLHISTCKSLGENMPCSIYTFKETNINIDVSMETDNSSNIIKKVVNHDINIGIIQDNLNLPDGIISLPMLSDKLVLVGPSNSNLDHLSLSSLYKIPLILRENGSSTLERVKDLLEANSINFNSLKVLLSLNSPESIKSSIASGRGFSFLPEISISQEIDSKSLKVIPIDNFEIDFKYYIIYRKNYILSDYEKKFIDFLISKKRCFCH